MQQSIQRPGRAPESEDDYGVQDVAELLATTPARVRGWVRAGLVDPRRGARGALRFSFRDLAFLRQVSDLEASRIPPRRVRRALRQLREEGDTDLTALALDARSGEVVVRENGRLFSPESGQAVFDFDPPHGGAEVVELGARRRDERAVEDWLRRGNELEAHDPEAACDAYREALALDPKHADAAINLGCLLHERDELEEAEAQYRAAVASRPDATSHFNLAVVLEDQRRDAEARRAYLDALVCDPACAEAYFNLANLCERAGDHAEALRHLTAYRRLSK